MERQFYRNHGAAVRAARKALFPDAEEGRDFKVLESPTLGHTWRPTRRPVVKAIMLLKRAGGATAAEIARKCGWQRHSAIGRVSWDIGKRMGMPIEKQRSPRRGLVYKIAA